MLADPRFATHADPTRLGMMGFSYGGAVTLIVAGAAPSLAHLATCRDRTDDPLACDSIPTDGSLANAVGRRSPDALAVKPLVLSEPWGSLFDRDGLASLEMPTLHYRAESSALKADGNILILAAGLPRPPRQETIPGAISYFSDHALPRWKLRHPPSARMLPASTGQRSTDGSRLRSGTSCTGVCSWTGRAFWRDYLTNQWVSLQRNPSYEPRVCRCW